MMQWLASGVVVLGCGYIGLVLASMMDSRIKQIEETEGIFRQLAFNITFLSMPFAQALSEASGTQKGAVAELFLSLAMEIEDNPEKPLPQSFQCVAGKAVGIDMKEPERDIIIEFLSRAGKGDRQEMADGIRLTLAKLETKREELLDKQKRDGKMCRGLGFLTGMLIVLILL